MKSIFNNVKQLVFKISKQSKIIVILSIFLFASLVLLFVNYRASKNLLRTIASVNSSMNTSIKIVDIKNYSNMNQLRQLYDKHHGYTKFLLDRAVETKRISDDLFKMIEEIKTKIIALGDGINPVTEQITDQSDKRIAKWILFKRGYADTIEQKITNAREKYINIVKEERGINIEKFVKEYIPLKIDKPLNSNKTWAELTFSRLPDIAVIALLTKIQIDIRNTQANIIDFLLNSINVDHDFFYNLMPVVSVTSGRSSVLVGEKYEAEILLAKYDSKQHPAIYLNGKALEVKDGRALYIGNTSNPGNFNLHGEIRVTNKSTGEITKYPFNVAYDVFKK